MGPEAQSLMAYIKEALNSIIHGLGKRVGLRMTSLVIFLTKMEQLLWFTRGENGLAYLIVL